METKKNEKVKVLETVGSEFVDLYWNDSWTYIKTVVDVVREPVLILDKNLVVLAANDAFYKTFQVLPEDTEKNIVYKLGNGQWNIPSLRKLLEDILPKHTFFRGFEVMHEFPNIGKKIMILNARQIHFKEEASFQPIILLAIEDITDMMDVADMLSAHTNKFEIEMAERTEKLESHIKKLEKVISALKKK